MSDSPTEMDTRTRMAALPCSDGFSTPHFACLGALREYVGSNSGLGLVGYHAILSTFQMLTLPGWFPFLFYSSEWVGEIYFQYSPEAPADSTDRSGDIGRVGSTALLAYSMITFIGSIVFPMLIQNPEDDQQEVKHSFREGSKLKGYLSKNKKPDLPSAYLVSHLIFAASMILAPLVKSFRFAALLVAVCGM